jgi:hypothetical protein
MTPEVDALDKALTKKIQVLADELQIKLGEKFLCERARKRLFAGGHPKTIKADLTEQGIGLD